MNKLTSVFAGVLALGLFVSVLPHQAQAAEINIGGFHFNTSVAARVPDEPMQGQVHASGTASTTGKNNGPYLVNAKQRADAEIARRIASLTDALTRITAAKNVSSTEKTSLQTSLNAQITSLNTLKAQIDAETATTTLHTSVQSITNGYRIYMLVMPQTRIAASADRIATIVADMQALAAKLQVRITAAQTAGTDVTAAQAAYTDMQTKLTDANTQAQAAVALIAGLTPDNGNTSVQASNTAAIKAAVGKIQLATADLKQARTDISAIVTVVGGTSHTGTTTPSH